MGPYEILFCVGIAMAAGSALLGLLTGIVLKWRGGRLRRLLDSEYGPRSKQEKPSRRVGKARP